jgi:hypothetical protein
VRVALKHVVHEAWQAVQGPGISDWNSVVRHDVHCWSEVAPNEHDWQLMWQQLVPRLVSEAVASHVAHVLPSTQVLHEGSQATQVPLPPAITFR